MVAYYSICSLGLLPADRIVVGYDDFLGDPAGAVERLVGWLGLAADAVQRGEAVPR